MKMKMNKKHIIDTMAKEIIGQDKVLAKIAYYVDVLSMPIIGVDKYTILLSGNSGTGKTLIAKEISKYINNNTDINVKFMSIVATEFSQEGYKGSSVAEFANKLRNERQNNITPIVFIDEIDKLINSNLEFRQSTLDDFLSIINENYIVMAGAFGNSNLFNIKASIKSISVELFTRIHDFIEFEDVNKDMVIQKVIARLQERYKGKDFSFITKITNSEKYKSISYRDISRLVYEADNYIYNNGLENAHKWLNNYV